MESKSNWIVLVGYNFSSPLMRRESGCLRKLGGPGFTSAPYPGRSQHMLVLSRQRDETIMIGDDIEVTVVDIRGDKVRLGINAPKEVTVHRKEVYDAIRRENRAAAQVKPEDLSGLGKIGPPQGGPSKEQGK
jgi:carbon storage regulator